MKFAEGTKAPSVKVKVELEQGRLLYFLAAVACILLVAAMIIVFNGGIRVGFSNHTGLLPVVRRILDPTYLLNDFNIQLRLYHHRIFAYWIAGLTKFLGEDNALIALSLVGNFLLSAALFVLCRVLKLSLLAFLAVGIFIALHVAFAGHGLEFNTFVGDPEIQPPTFSHAFFLFGVAAFLKERFELATFCVGLALLLHLQIGIGLELILLPFYVSSLKTLGLRRSLVCLTVFLFLVALTFFDVSHMIDRGLLKLPLTRAYIDFRQPHHFELESIKAVLWILGYLLLQLFAWLWLRRIKDERERSAFVLFALSVLITGLSAIHFADYYFGQNNEISKLQFVRLSCLITVFGIISLIVVINTVAPSNPSRADINLVIIICGALLTFFPATRYGGGYSFSISKYRDQKSDWVDVCLWVKANLPANTLFLTPPGEEGFVYLASRSNIGDFKNNPDGSQFLAEWYERVRDLAGGKLPQAKGFANGPLLNQAYCDLTREQLVDLGNKYKAELAVLPKNSAASFATLYENQGFKVVRLRTTE